MKTSLRFCIFLLWGLSMLAVMVSTPNAYSQGVTCVAPDSSGTAALPASCPFIAPSGTMDIVDGLPPGTTIHSVPTIDSIIDIVRSSGGSLGGETEQFKATLTLVMTGTGDLSTFSRTISISVGDIVDAAARTAGTSPQDIDLDLHQMQGQITGDPDFDLLRISAGTGFGMPSPGHTTLTRKPSGDWNVDSFFDITYRIDFVGAPGGSLAGRSGSTTATIRMQQGGAPPSNACLSPDNGTGTTDLPAGCLFFAPSGTMDIINGLPPGTTLTSFPTLGNFSGISRSPGGTLDGEVEQFSADLTLVMEGNGSLGTYRRTFVIPHVLEVHTGPRNLGSLRQSFATDLRQLQGQITGDPDFDLLRITAGTGFGMPSPGHTTLTKKPSDEWNVDSFFDITYRIDFVGHSGGPLSGMSGSTTGTIRLRQGEPTDPPPFITLTPNLPPIPSRYVSQAGYHQQFSGGMTIKDISLERFTNNQSPPPPGSSQVQSFGSTVRMKVSTDGGSTFQPASAPASVSVRVAYSRDDSSGTHYDTEMLSLDLSGGTLPPGVMIRESPTKASTGRVLATPDQGSTWRIGSFFDIFTEISLDGGASWSPSSDSARVELEDVPLPPPIVVMTTSFPPIPSQFINNERQRFGTVVSRIGAVTGAFTVGNDPPALGVTQTQSFGATVHMQISTNGGTTFQPYTAPAMVSVSVHHTRDSSGTGYFDTEMLSLNVQPFGGGILFRESPTLASRGIITAKPGSTGGTYRINSFFDVFTEISLDGGTTWEPADGAAHIELQDVPMPPPIVVTSTSFPPIPSQCADTELQHYGSGAAVRNVVYTGFTGNVPPPPPGGHEVVTFSSTVHLEISTDGGATFQQAKAGVSHSFAWNSTSDLGSTRNFETEILLLDISGGTLPAGVMIRESPTLASKGIITAKPAGGTTGNYLLNSFFDVFTELSLNGGATWVPADGAAHLELQDVPLPPPIIATSTSLPPIPSQYGDAELQHYANGVLVRNVVYTGFTVGNDPPVLGVTQTQSFGATVHMEVSTDGGSTYTMHTRPGNLSVSVHHTRDSSGTGYFDTEMLSLNVQPLGGGIMIRESPTKQSLGRTTTELTPPSGGGLRINSFFDIFTELSLDGGLTWVPSDGASQIELQDVPLPTPIVTLSPNLPPIPGRYRSSGIVLYGNGNVVDHATAERFTHNFYPPDPGVTQTNSFGSTVTIDISLDSGRTFQSHSGRVDVFWQVTHTYDDTAGSHYDTEMLSLNLSGGTLPPGVMIRESPTLASRGIIVRKPSGSSGNYRIGSFFDVFTELSLDGGSTWSPAATVMHLELQPVLNGQVCVLKYFDENHNGLLDLGEQTMSGVGFTLASSETTVTGQTDTSGRVCLSVPAGSYTLTETVPSGYTVSSPSSGSMSFVVTEALDTMVTWLNSAARSDTTYRTARYLDWATAVDQKNKLKSIVCKPNKVAFKFRIKAPKAATGVTLKFDMFTRGVLYTDTTKLGRIIGWDSAKTVAAVVVIDSGEILQVDGRGFKGNKVKPKVEWATLPRVTRATVAAGDFAYNTLLIPMPNLHNVGEAIYGGVRQTSVSILIGVVTNSAGAHTVILPKYSDVLKSLVKESRGVLKFHDGPPRCLDSLDSNHKPILKQLKGLPPDKQNNSLFAEQVILKLNIAASDSGIFPSGFGELIYNASDSTSIFNGLTVRQIAMVTDSFMSCLNFSERSYVSGYFMLAVCRNLNSAFAGPVDTTSWSCGKPILKGVKALKDVPYLKANPGAVRPTMQPAWPSMVYVEPTVYALRQNYPNPFNPTTTIQLDLPEPAVVTLKIYNLLGQEVATLLDHEPMEDGTQEVVFNAASLPSGVYFYRITAQGIVDEEQGILGKIFTSVKKMLLLK